MVNSHQRGQDDAGSKGINEKEVATVTAEDDQERFGYRSVKEVTVRSVVRRMSS